MVVEPTPTKAVEMPTEIVFGWEFSRRKIVLERECLAEYKDKVRIIFSFIEDKGWLGRVKKRDGVFSRTRANYSLNKNH